MAPTVLLLVSVFVSCAIATTGHGPQKTAHGVHGPIKHCDDGQTGVKKDFLMLPKRLWRCRSQRWPSLRNDYNKPAGESKCYELENPYHRCVGDSIKYTTDPPSSGGHRPAYPVYGEYGYIPATRWIHSLEHGAVAFLYHPCASREDIDLLRQVARSCLRRHIITPYVNLTAERPFALVAWGCVLRMKWVDVQMAKEFVRKYAMSKAVEYHMWQDGVYAYSLRRRAETVSDKDESNLCPQMSPTLDQFTWTTIVKRSTYNATTVTKGLHILTENTALPISTAHGTSTATSRPTVGRGLLSRKLNTSQQNQVVNSGNKSQKAAPTNAGQKSKENVTIAMSEVSTVVSQTHVCSNSTEQCPHQLAKTRLVWSVLAIISLAAIVLLGLLCMRSNDLGSCCSGEVVYFDQRRHKATHVPMRQQLVRFAENLPMSGKSRVTNTSNYKRLMQHDVDEDDV